MSDARLVTCPVCATGIVGSAHACSRCSTPHHADCASFIGRCALFGCGGTQFRDQALDTAVLTLTQGDVEPPTGVIDVTPRLRRGIGGRLAAAARLASGNLDIFLPLLALAVAFNFGFGEMAALVTPQVVQCILVILLVSRAKGKESSLGWAIAALLKRLPRIAWNFVAVGFIVGFLFLLAGVLGWAVAVAGKGGQLPAALAAAALSFLVVYKAFDRATVYGLSQIVAALGKDEEPGTPRHRSEELISVGYWQAFGAFFLFAFSGGAIGGVIGAVKKPLFGAAVSMSGAVAADLFQHAILGALGLITSTYWILFYLEARKARRPLDLAYTPAEFGPGPSQPAD